MTDRLLLNPPCLTGCQVATVQPLAVRLSAYAKHNPPEAQYLLDHD